jgi:glutathione S-transferase
MLRRYVAPMPIVLHRPPGAWGTRSLSPFAIKLEAYLRLAGIPYEARGGDPQRSPNGKVPYVRLEDGTLLADSQRVIDLLESLAGAAALDAGLDGPARARGHLVRRTLEEATYFHLVRLRWDLDDGYATTRAAFLHILPPFVGPLAMPFVRRQVRAMLHAQGAGRLPVDRMHADACADFDALAAILSDGPFLLGDRPRTVDAVAFAFLNALLAFPVPSPARDHVAAVPALVAYEARVRAVAFPEDPAPGALSALSR